MISLRKVDLFSVPRPEKKMNLLIEVDRFNSFISSELKSKMDLFNSDLF